MPMIKIFGLILLVSSCSFFGFSKSFSVRARAKKLSLFCDGLALLYEYIEQGNFELEAAIKNAFSSCDFIAFKSLKPYCKDRDLSTEDKEIINSFFKSIGHSAKKAECDRVAHCRAVIKKRADAAISDTERICKLYQTFGICIGLVLGILLI